MGTQISPPIFELFLFLNSIVRDNSKKEVTLNQTGPTDQIVKAFGLQNNKCDNTHTTD